VRVVFLFVSLILLFSACATQKRVVVADVKEYPRWYLKPPITDADTLYSVGDGQSKEDAIANALSMMVSTLSVSISSQFNSKSVIKEGTYSSNTATYTNEVQSDVKKIRITNYELISSQSMGYKQYIVLIKSDKKKLFDGLLQEIEQRFSMFEKQESNNKNLNAIKKLLFYKSSKESLKDIPNNLMVMKVLNTSFNDEKYLNKLQKIDERYLQTLSSISFSIESNKQATNLKSPISKAINAQKYKIKKTGAKNHFTIYIKSSIVKSKSYGFTLARSAIDISVKDYKGNLIGSNKLDIIGQSTQGYEVAKQNIAFKLNAIIEKDGIEQVIGLKI
jgi:hypothetical protein